jgi:hypothetical protein
VGLVLLEEVVDAIKNFNSISK